MPAVSLMNRSEAGKLGKLASLATEQRKRDERIARYNLTPKRCRRCKSPFEYDKRWNIYCGHSCAAASNNSGIIRNGRSRLERLHACKGCEKQTVNKSYCSASCQMAQPWIRTKAFIEANSTFPPWHESTNRHHARRYLRETRGWKCEICGLAEWLRMETPLVLDHIDGNGENFKLENIRLVCPNCDAQLPTYKSKNRGKGRIYRRRASVAQTGSATDL